MNFSEFDGRIVKVRFMANEYGPQYMIVRFVEPYVQIMEFRNGTRAYRTETFELPDKWSRYIYDLASTEEIAHFNACVKAGKYVEMWFETPIINSYEIY
jgi:hypothetical protein